MNHQQLLHPHVVQLKEVFPAGEYLAIVRKPGLDLFSCFLAFLFSSALAAGSRRWAHWRWLSDALIFAGDGIRSQRRYVQPCGDPSWAA